MWDFVGNLKFHFGEQTGIICFENVRVLEVDKSFNAPFLTQNCSVKTSQASVCVAEAIIAELQKTSKQGREDENTSRHTVHGRKINGVKPARDLDNAHVIGFTQRRYQPNKNRKLPRRFSKIRLPQCDSIFEFQNLPNRG